MRRTSLPFKLVFGSSAKLRSYEEAVIEAVTNRLDVSIATKLKAQLKLLPYRQRQDEDRIIAFFPDEGNSLPEAVLFRNTHNELSFATVEMRCADGQGVVVARLYAATRRFFSIEFDVIPSSQGIEDGRPITIVKTLVTANPDSPDNGTNPPAGE